MEGQSVVSVPEPRAPKGMGRGRVARVAPLAGLAGRTVGEAVAASLRQRRHGPDGDDAWRPFHVRNAQRYAELMGRSRGVLLKAAQIMSVVLPDEAVGDDVRGIYGAAFARLLDEVPPMPIDTVTHVLEAELGQDLSEIFAEFHPVPVGSASIGQVHEATLRDGRRVAVKVQYPGVEQAIRSDLHNTELVATFLRLVLSMVPGTAAWDTRGIAREITERISEEIDYRIEAANQREFAAAYRDHPFVRIPELVPEVCTERVLTMEFVEGLRYSAATRVDDSVLRDRWGEAVFRFTFNGLWRLGIVNADVNPGNFVFHRDGTVTFLDFGCVSRFTQDRIRVMFGFIKPAADGDETALYRWAHRGGYVEPDRLPPPDMVLAFFLQAYGYILADGPVTITPEGVTHAIRTRLDRTGEFEPMTRVMTMPADLTMATRLDTGLLGLLGGLRATAPWRAIFGECDLGTGPATAYGQLDAAYRAAS